MLIEIEEGVIILLQTEPLKTSSSLKPILDFKLDTQNNMGLGGKE